jgi:hypothetical protein
MLLLSNIRRVLFLHRLSLPVLKRLIDDHLV